MNIKLYVFMKAIVINLKTYRFKLNNSIKLNTDLEFVPKTKQSQRDFMANHLTFALNKYKVNDQNAFNYNVS